MEYIHLLKTAIYNSIKKWKINEKYIMHVIDHCYLKNIQAKY